MLEEKRTVLVTGATGFVGRRLCERFKAAGFAVVAVGRQPVPGPWDRFIACDLAAGALAGADLKGLWGICHLAGLAHVTLPQTGVNPYWALSVDATERLLRMAHEAGVSRFLYMSSVKAMGEGNPSGMSLLPMDTTSPAGLLSAYGWAKWEGEQLVRGSGLPHPVVLRPAMVFGSDGKGNLPRMREAILRNRFPPLPETGNRRSMVHVDDLVEMALRALQQPVAAGKTYLVCHPEAVSTRQLFDAMREALGREPFPVSIPLGLLKVVATIGSGITALTGRPVPFDRGVLEKLTGSAWYDARLAEEELGYVAQRSVLEWIRQPEI